MEPRQFLKIVDRAQLDSAITYLVSLWSANGKGDPIGEAKTLYEKSIIHSLVLVFISGAFVVPPLIWTVNPVLAAILFLFGAVAALVSFSLIFTGIDYFSFGSHLDTLLKRLDLQPDDLLEFTEESFRKCCSEALAEKAYAVVAFQAERKGVAHEHWEDHERVLKRDFESLLHLMVVLGIFEGKQKPWYTEAEKRLRTGIPRGVSDSASATNFDLV